jgi:uncharacterized membrane protein YcaP (DUF421 family)
MDSIARGLAVYFFLLLVFRLSGKRTLAQTTPFDLILLLIISETTQQAMVDNDHSMTNAALLILTLVGADLLLSVLKLRFQPLHRLLEGLPLVLVREGRTLDERMKRSRVDKDDVLSAARLQHGLERLEDVRYAVLETSGEISIIPKR